MQIRLANPDDFDGIWPIFHDIVKKGDSHVYFPDTTKEQACHVWMNSGVRTYVACEGTQILATYKLKANREDLGNHVANVSYMVAPALQGQGLGKKIGEHSLVEARRLGYQAMQFNMVVSTNQPAVALWQKLGFQIVGTVPKAFRHAEQGLVDVYVMYRSL
jgi:L-amino acid N-acyltransferase YncA